MEKSRIKFLIILNIPLLKNLAVENFQGRLKQANKTDFDNKLTSFNKRITSNKTKHLEAQKKLDSLKTKNYIFLGRIYFKSNDGSQSKFIYRQILDTLELKKTKVLIILFV